MIEGGSVLTGMLVQALPELRADVHDAQAKWGHSDMGAHNLADEVLNPYLERLLKTDPLPEDDLVKAWDFVEGLAAHPEAYFQEVAAVTIVEQLVQDKVALRIGRRFMGPQTTLMADAMEKAWG